MSIAAELNRIQNAKSALKEAINAKGGTLGTETLEHYAQAVYCLKTEGTAVISSPDFFKCAAVKGATSYNAIQMADGSGAFPITRDPEGDYTYSYTTPEHMSGTYLEATAYGYTYTTEGGGVVQCVMDTDDPKYGDYIYSNGTNIRGDDWKFDGVGSIGVYTTAYIPPEWSGYKAVLTDGVYTFEEAVTEGLPFGNGFTPKVGKIYNGDATVRVERLFEGASAVPEVGLVFYMPFNGNAEPVEGSVTSMTGELTYGEVNGIVYGVFDGSQHFDVSLSENVGGDYTTFCAFCVDALPTETQTMYQRSGTDEVPNGYLPPSAGVSSFGYSTTAYGTGQNASITPGQWYASIITFESASRLVKLYLNNSVFYQNTDSEKYHPNLGDASFRIGYGYGGYQSVTFTGKLADFAVWNRVLTEEEIALLASRAESMN